MEGDRAKKIEAGREKFAAYKKKKQKRSKQSLVNSPSHSSDSSSSNLSVGDLVATSKTVAEDASESSSVSEHLQSTSGSIENDRSLQEIEISNSNFSLILSHLPEDQDGYRLSQEKLTISPAYLSDRSETIIADKISNVVDDVQNILIDILNGDEFGTRVDDYKSDLPSDTNDISINIFEGVSLDDSSINNYVTKIRRASNLSDANCEELNKIVTSEGIHSLSEESEEKIKELQKQLIRKDSEIAALSAELDSLKELTNSLSTTDYKPYQEEYHNKLVGFQNAIQHRDNLIDQLTESLQQSILNREELQRQSESFAKEISLLQKQLYESSNDIKQHKCSTAINMDHSNSPVKLSPTVSDKQLKGRKMHNSTSVISLDMKDESVTLDENVLVDLEEVWSRLEESFGADKMLLLNDLKAKVNIHVQRQVMESNRKLQDDMKILQEKVLIDKADYETEISKLRELLTSLKSGSVEFADLKKELDAQHAIEMEELRRYFEKKCADVEKHYSEEVFSQHSRKMSGSSVCSDIELNSEGFSLRHPTGPGGDTLQQNIDPLKIGLGSLTSDDLIKIKADLTRLSGDFAEVDFEHLPEDGMKAITAALANSSLRILVKYFGDREMEVDSRCECSTELDKARQEFERRIDVLKAEHDVYLADLKAAHQEEINALRYELNEVSRNAQMSVTTAVQEVASSGEYELAEVVLSYERRLQEQVTLAKIDIITALEHQIQVLADSDVDSEWPVELLQIRNRFTERYEKQMEAMRNQHAQEISELKEEHYKVLNGALERARRRSIRDGDSIVDTDIDLLKDRENLKKTNSILRHLLAELLVFFTRCEDELNKTLVDEIMKYTFDRDVSQIENDLNVSINSAVSNFSENVSPKVTKRVHFTPNFKDFMNIVDTVNVSGLDSKDISIDLKNELGSCLERLKADANAILALTTNLPANTLIDNGPNPVDGLEEKISSLNRQIIADSQIKNDLTVELEETKNYVRNLESERVSLENHVEQLVDKQKVLERNLLEANKKICDLIECGHKEIVSEGYGQDHRNTSLGGKIACLAELQEKARTLVAEWKNGADHPLIQLVEELCREGERITEEAKKDKEDLRQQVEQAINVDSSCGVKIEAADRKLRATCCFLEEQAVEREMERDESHREITALKEQLRERDKEREACELVAKEGETDLPLNACCRNIHIRINSTVEQLETQMREMTRLIEEGEHKREEVENERKEAVDKIWVLRDIIRDLEYQVETKTEVEAELKRLIAELEDVVKQQTSNLNDLSQQLDIAKGDENVHVLKERIIYLENEAQKLRLNSELIGAEGAVKEIQIQLSHIEGSLDKKTKILEGLHTAISTTSCSSPSEDMSIRDQIRPQTPGVLEECDVPLQQLARLKEKLVKHSRAEDAAVKRIRDLEMQLSSTKQELDEMQSEKDILQNQVTEQIVLLSSLQMRLDEQRLKAEHNQRQANSSLEVRIYDLENEVQSLRETIHCKEKSIKQLNKVLEQTKERLEDREKELCSKEQDESVAKVREEIDRLTEENRLLKSKIESDAQNAQILPNLVDNIIADKNADIENLRERLSDVEKRYDEYRSLNLDLEQLKQLSEMVTSDRTLTDILTLMNLSGSNVDRARKAHISTESMESPVNLLLYNRNSNETTLIGNQKPFFNPEMSSIEREGPPNVNFTVDEPLLKPNSTEIHKSLEKKVHFDDEIDLQRKLAEKDEIIQEYSEKLKVLSDLEKDIEILRENLEKTEAALSEATEKHERERKTFGEMEKDTRIELAEAKMRLTEKEGLLTLAEEDNRRKDQMCVDLAKEAHDFRLALEELESAVNGKNEEIDRLEAQLGKLVESCVDLEAVRESMRRKEDELEEAKRKCANLEEELVNRTKEYETLLREHRDQSNENAKLTKELKNKSEQLDSLSRELVEANDKKEAMEEVKRLKDLLDDRECELEILNEDIVRYQDEIAKLEQDLKSGAKKGDTEMSIARLQKEVAERDLELLKLRTVRDDLNKEIQHLQDHVQEKDRVIEQMKADTRSLHVNLETIQNKIQETGNIVDLRKRLQEEQHVNAVLREEIDALKNIEAERKERSMSIEDIAGQVRKQLDYSAHLDSNILQALSSGDELNDGSPEHQQLNAEFERKLAAERERNDRLRDLLEKEKKLSATVQIEDANLIEQMRIRLEEALDAEKEFEKCLERERKQRIDLENQVTALKLKLTNLSTSSNSKTETTEYKSLPNMESQEVMRLREELSRLTEENEQLTVDLRTLKRGKSEAEANLRYAKDMLELKLAEEGKAQSHQDEMRKVEIALREELQRCRSELEQKIRETENSRELLGELEKERQDMKKKILSLSDVVREMEEEKRINKLAHQQRDADLSSTVPAKFLSKMTDLTDSLKEQMEENKMLMDTLSKMTIERSKLLQQIRALEDRNNHKMPFDDPVSRANHLFGKYLRSESYRKALVWQKRYLTALLATYQDFRPITERLPLSTFEPKDRRSAPRKMTGKQRFKCGVIAVIAIVRMKYMVQRWHSGKRVAAYSKYPPTNPSGKNGPLSTQFQVGQPVSSQNFSAFARTDQARPQVPVVGQVSRNSADVGRSRESSRDNDVTQWSGTTPPQKDRTTANTATTSVLPQSEFIAPLDTPQVLTYFKRFNEIQQRLGMTLDNLNS